MPELSFWANADADLAVIKAQIPNCGKCFSLVCINLRILPDGSALAAEVTVFIRISDKT